MSEELADLEKRFRCLRCGACCRWEGPVRVSEEEIKAIAAFLEMEESLFIKEYTCLAPDRKSLSLLEKEDGSCLYLDDEKGCLIQEVKPLQCREFPYKWKFPGWEKECAGGRALLNEEGKKG